MCGLNRMSAALAATALLCFAAAPATAADDEVCKEFTKKNQRIERLAGPRAFSKTPVKSPGDLVQQLEDHRAELEVLLRDRGLGHLTDALITAAGDSRSLSERPLERGEVFEWMAYRKRTGPETIGPVCFAAKKTYEAYEIMVREEESMAAHARCSVEANGHWDDEEITVDASGSSPGVEVTMTGPGGRKTIISGGGTSWHGMPDGPGTYEFTARAQARGTNKVTTHTFVAPKVCLNLSYAGASTREEEGEVDTCTDSATLEIAPRLPECTITEPAMAEVLRKETFTLNAEGSNYDSLTVKVKDTATGQYVQIRDDDTRQPVSELSEFPKSVSIKRSGEYVIEGTASNAQGTETCEKSLTVNRPPYPDWTFRGSLMKLNNADNQVFKATVRPDGIPERSGLRLDGGLGLAAALERHFNERLGLEVALLWADLDSSLIVDRGTDWQRDTGSATFLSFLVGPNFHLTPGKKVDFYLGPFVGWADIGGSTFTLYGENQSRDFGNDFVYGAQLGFDILFGDGPWGLHLGGRYMQLSVGDNADKLDVNPLIGELGFFRNF